MNATSAFSRLSQIAALALVLTGTHAFGQTLMTTSPSQSPQAWTILGSSGGQSLVFDGFNTALGTLQSVTITLTNVVVSGNATLTANTTGQSVISARLEGSFLISDGTNLVSADVISATGTSKAVALGSTYYVLAAPNNGAVTSTGPPSGAQNITTGPQDGSPTVITSNLSFYQGGSNSVTLALSGGTNLTSSTTGGFNTSVTGTATGNVTVVYTYLTAVPEPSTTAGCMIAFGLVLLVGRNFYKGRGFRLA